MSKNRSERKKNRQEFINKVVYELGSLFIECVENGMKAEDINKKLSTIVIHKVNKDPQNKHLYKEAISKFSNMIESGLENIHKKETDDV